MSGWIKLHRSLLGWEWFDDANTLKVWIWLLLSVNHEPRKWQGIVIDTGQLVTSYPKIADANKITARQARSVIGKLKMSGEVSVKTTNSYSLITLANWDLYQTEINNMSGEQSGEQSGECQADVRRTVTKQEVKNLRIKELKEKKLKQKKETHFEKYAGDDKALLNALHDFEIMRKTIRRPMTDRAKELLTMKLDKLADGSETKIAILEQSTANSWQGVFELRSENNAVAEKPVTRRLGTYV